MGKDATIVPSHGTRMRASNVWQIKIQGTRNHDRWMTLDLYHGLHALGGNLACHSLATDVNRLIEVEGDRRPRHAIYSADGGPENQNVTRLGLAQLLVARGIFDSITLERPPVGKSHNLTDSIFGAIKSVFTGDRDASILTPQQFIEALVDSLKGSLKSSEGGSRGCIRVVPHGVVGDWELYLDGHLIDAKKLKYWTKGSDAVGLWLFEKVEASDRYPLGVRISWKRYMHSAAHVNRLTYGGEKTVQPGEFASTVKLSTMEGIHEENRLMGGDEGDVAITFLKSRQGFAGSRFRAGPRLR